MMPKGYKKETGYGTSKSLGGLSYHKIAETMNEKSFKMNHSTARNLFVSGLMKIADNLAEVNDQKLNKAEIKKIAIDPRFQEAVADYMREVEYERKCQNYNK
jgi:tRNA A37 threonylcarbamoyltransferase TsaD